VTPGKDKPECGTTGEFLLEGVAILLGVLLTIEVFMGDLEEVDGMSSAKRGSSDGGGVHKSTIS
jgi:hypothetical protein